MTSGTLILLLLVIGPVLAMMFMHRGGAGMGGCGMGHGSHGNHGRDSENDPADENGERRPMLGNPGEKAPVAAGNASGKHDAHGCH